MQLAEVAKLALGFGSLSRDECDDTLQLSSSNPVPV